MEDDANFKKRMRELVDDGYIVFDKLGRWRVTEKGLACLLACADRQAKITASQERTPSNE
jgi:predicted transcriptional regulator